MEECTHLVFHLLVICHVWGRTPVAMQPDTQDLAQCGPRLCVQLCRHNVGCQLDKYHVVEMACHMKKINLSSVTEDEQLIWSTASKERCPRAFKTFSTRNKLISCQTLLDGKRCSNKAGQFRVREDEEEPRTRLLISKPSGRSQTHLRQLNLNTSSFSIYYPCLISCQVTALLYLSIRRTVLIAIPNRNSLKACALDDGKLSTLKLRLRVKDMDVDESRQLVFMNVIGHGVTIYRMTTTGANLTQVINVKKYTGATDIVVDEKRKNLYISLLTKVVISVSYEGNNMHTIVKNLIKVYSMALEPNQDVLYYINDKIISVFSLQTNISRYVSRLPMFNYDMVHYDNKLYISIWDSLITFDLKSNETKEMSIRIASICLVP